MRALTIDAHGTLDQVKFRDDLPVPVMTFLMGSMKLGIVHSSDVLGQELVPSAEQLTEALSDLIRRWLEPEQLPSDTSVGKHIAADWLEKTNEIEQEHR